MVVIQLLQKMQQFKLKEGELMNESNMQKMQIAHSDKPMLH
jgi:hypothetical protein